MGIELFKLLNLAFCSFVVFHYYSALGEFLHNKLPALPVEPAIIFSYIVLITIITLLFRILREGFFVFVKTEIVGNFSKYLGLILGFIRGILISALIIFGLMISTIHYFDLSARTSFFGSKIVKLPINIYVGTLSGATSRVFPEQALNQDVINVLERGNFTKPKNP